jgi:multidrug efflux system outer membrane protein
VEVPPVNIRCLTLAILAGAAAATGQPVVPKVSDPMLAPAPRAPVRLGSWEEVLRLIRARSPTYAASAQGIERAEGLSRVALAGVLPNLTAEVGYTHQFRTETVTLGGQTIVTPAPNLFSGQGTVAWNVLSPRALYGVGTARRGVEAARLTFEDARRQIATNAIEALLATLSTARVAELNRIGLRTALERLALTEARLEFGQGTQLDHDRALQDVAAARDQVVGGDESLRQSREALALLLGMEGQVEAPPELDLAGFERAVAQTCRLNQDIEQRPDVAAARVRVEVADRNVDDALLQAAPFLSIVAQGGYASEPTLAPGATFAVGATLTFPLYDGGARYGFLRQNRAAANEARAALTETRLAAAVGAARADRAVGVLTASRDLAREQRDLAQRIDQRTRTGYGQGLGTSLDLVTSAQALRAAENRLALLEFQVAQARADALLTNAECAF